MCAMMQMWRFTTIPQEPILSYHFVRSKDQIQAVRALCKRLSLLSHLSGSANSNRYKSEHLHRPWNMDVMCAWGVPHLVTVYIHTKFLWQRHSDYLHLKEEKQGKFRRICLRSTSGMVNPECHLDTPGETEPQTEKLPPSDWHVGISFQHFLYY